MVWNCVSLLSALVDFISTPLRYELCYCQLKQFYILSDEKVTTSLSYFRWCRYLKDGDDRALIVSCQYIITCLKYLREYWYIVSTSAMLATTKYMTEPRVATGRYFSRAAVIFSSVISASFNRVLITPEVTWVKGVMSVTESQIRIDCKSLFRDGAYFLSALSAHGSSAMPALGLTLTQSNTLPSTRLKWMTESSSMNLYYTNQECQ